MGHLISAYFLNLRVAEIRLACRFSSPQFRVEKALKQSKQSKATVVTIIAYEIAQRFTSALELHISHMEVAFGSCKLLPVIGKK